MRFGIAAITTRQYAQNTYRCGHRLCAGARKAKEAAYSEGDNSPKSRQALTHLLDKELSVPGELITFP
jgi:hypothetical protein